MFARCILLAASLSVIAWADQSGNATLAPDTFLNLDTGAVSQSGGDIFFDGFTLVPQGGAGLHNLGKYGSRTFKSIQARHATAVSYTADPIPAATLVTGDVFGVHTGDGHYAKVIVTATNNGALSLQYAVFGVAVPRAAATGPVITQLQNNFSWILPGIGLPNYGIAPGSIFVIIGTSLSSSTASALQSSAPPGLPTSLNQTSISVTVNGVTTTPALYYTSANQLAAVLPSTTPAGNGTITVTYNGQPSAAAPIKVVANAPGLDTLYGTGNGLAVATDVNGNFFGLTNSATPGQTIVLWGSGLGADQANDDRTYPQKTDNLVNIPLQIFVGGISANVLYQGRSQYPGLDQFDVVIPQGVTTGCFVSVVAQVGSVVSNAVTLPVSPNGGSCSDATTGLNGTQIQSLANKPGGNVNGVAALLSVHPGGTGSNAFVIAGSIGAANFGKGYEYASQGSCTIVPPEQGSFLNVGTALDAGAIQLNGPNGQVSLGTGPGIYSNQTSFNASPGAYTFTGSGGKDVGKFSVSFSLPSASFGVTNQAALASITRSQGATVNWTGGFPNGTVQVEGNTGAPGVKFYCYAPSSAGQLTIPPSILLALPAGTGKLVIGNTTAPQVFAASNNDLGFAAASFSAPNLSPTFK
jgi:uncharacterized protein (TIGR03437 family)